MSEEDFGDDIGEDPGEEFSEETVEEEAGSGEGEDQVQPDTDSDEEVALSQEGNQKNPSLVINVHSWATPIVGLVMLLVGLLGGYLIYPLIPTSQTETPVAAAPSSTPDSASQAATANGTQAPNSLQEVMGYLDTQLRHVKGDPEAAVTLIEFSDFQ